ncbi:MAG: LPS assembly lipoprotein LptE [Phyllobacteriaceae bacterium]|nr:LPS assembly lipoprotein LptE [Phyllobacteriaceae bacterium]
MIRFHSATFATKPARRRLARPAMGLTVLALAALLQGCQFQPLYSSDSGTVAGSNLALSSISVAEVDTRVEQQARNHLIFLLSGGAAPPNPTHEVRIRVASNSRVLAARVKSGQSSQIGNTAGSVELTASYEIYDFASKQIIHRGSRFASAAYDKTSQSFASERAQRDAENRAAREVAEQLRFAIASDLSSS